VGELTMPSHSVVIEVGELSVNLQTIDSHYCEELRNHYRSFVSEKNRAEFYFDVELTESGINDPDDDVRVIRRSTVWSLERGDFSAQWNIASSRGRIRQCANLYSIDSALRIFHTVVLAAKGGFLLHAASAIRNGKAFLFAGPSGAGKTTISRSAPPNAVLLTDEVSYIRKRGDGYVAFGTPFAGELAKFGENVSAPVAALYLLQKGAENRIESVHPTDAVRALMTNILFFADDQDLVRLVFQSACQFVERVNVQRLTFVPNASAWESIG
jgi:hypothetical protein